MITKLITIICLSLLFNTSEEKIELPNIIFIMSDDHAESAISYYNDKLINTPNIDRIGVEGVKFNNSFVTNSICAPSRATMLTGKYSHKNGLRDNRDEFDGSQQTYPKLLQKAGYETMLVGKWHLKTEPTGFDSWKVLTGQGEYYNPEFKTKNGTKEFEGYTTDIITELSIDALENRNKDKPFLLLMHHKAPHRNWMPHTKYLDSLEERDFPIPPTFYDDYKTRENTAGHADMRIEDMFLSMDMKLQRNSYEFETGSGGATNWTSDNSLNVWLNSYSRMPKEHKELWDEYYSNINQEYKNLAENGKSTLEWKYQRYMKDYLKCILSVDESVGNVLDYLDEQNLSKNTIVVYTSDQGFYLGEHGWYDKRFMYEESFSMPLLIRYPNEIKPGTVSNELVMNLDFAETFLDYAGVQIPSDMQGESLREICRGKKVEDWRNSVYYHYYEYPHGWHMVRPHYGLRTHKYKIINFYGEKNIWEFYDLQKDPNELHNEYSNPLLKDKIKELKIELSNLQEYYEDIQN